jgi:hypothetical protein
MKQLRILETAAKRKAALLILVVAGIVLSSKIQALALPLLAFLGPAKADLNPAALQYKLPSQIEWKDTSIGAKMAVMHGDPDKPGPYIVLIKWGSHQMSRPHFHPNDRFITVISGTWWVGTGSKFDPETTVPMPAGSFVTHFAKQVHYDGSRDGEAIIEIVGEGPATATPAETK